MANPLCHFELMSADPQRARAFYGSVFDWQFNEEPSMPGYTLINTGVEPTGAMFPKPDDAPTACLNIYFQVPDVEAALAKAVEHGGSILVPKTTIPGVGFFGMFADPEGLAIGIMQPLT